ncbi:MAG TPA: divalent-cation tolerance protein CutA [Candidatus Moranbacteria bacterium]|nr:divalent-cation tolerance protein CutA [Candidatus Moranbacteria bacterium]
MVPGSNPGGRTTMNNLIFIYITNPSKKEAKKIAKHLLGKKLIACANIFSVDSLYHWKNKIADEREHILIAKTLSKNFEKIKKEVEKIHSYSIPCITKIPVESNNKYFKWIKKEC